MRRSLLVLVVVVAPALAYASPARAVGEATPDGFPNWAERVIHEWMNRARADPQVEMAACGPACGDGACYQPIAPLTYLEALNRSARFHSDEMLQQSYFAHNSTCTVVSGIASSYPAPCNGAASCACVGGTDTCSPSCTTWDQRIALFGASAAGEIIASGTDPNGAFYQWLFEPFSMSTCMYVQGPPTNGHRWQILMAQGPVGAGVSGPSTGDFSGGGGTVTGIPSGSHYPRQGSAVDVWANWYAGGGPSLTLVNVDGTCTPMTLGRGAVTNGAYTATLSSVASGCHRYYFLFKDASGTEVDYPTTGSLGIGPASCADWDSSRPSVGPGCGGCTPSCAGKVCGDDGCGGSCGTCSGGASCQGGQCVGVGMDAGAMDAGSASDGGGGADGGPPDGGSKMDGGRPADGGSTPDGGRATSDGGGVADGNGGGVGPSGSDGGSGAGDSGSTGGCSCKVGGTSHGWWSLLAFATLTSLAGARRRRREPG